MNESNFTGEKFANTDGEITLPFKHHVHLKEILAYTINSCFHLQIQEN